MLLVHLPPLSYPLLQVAWVEYFLLTASSKELAGYKPEGLVTSLDINLLLHQSHLGELLRLRVLRGA